jgi:hypothetical protein
VKSLLLALAVTEYPFDDSKLQPEPTKIVALFELTKVVPSLA